MNRESAEKRLKIRSATIFDFVDIDLYNNPDYYTQRDTDYWIWSETKQEFEKYHTTEHLRLEDLDYYLEKGLICVKESFGIGQRNK